MRRFLPGVLLLSILLASCASLPRDYPRPVTTAFPDTSKTRIANDIRPLLSLHPGESGFYLLTSGVDAFVARMLLTSAAERSIDLQYYLFHDDTSGRLLVKRLLKAADRGVRVRLLLDDIDTVGKDGMLAVLDAHPNIEVRLFNPFAQREERYTEYVTRFGEVTRRMHNKAMIVDNQVAIVGGRNIGDEYFDRDQELSFGDMDLLSIGPVVPDVSHAFDLYWNHKLSVPISALDGKETESALERFRKKLFDETRDQRQSEYRTRVEHSNLMTEIRQKRLRFYWGKGMVLYDKPDKLLADDNDHSSYMLPALRAAIKEIHCELVIFSPYFVPTESGVAMFKRMVQSGIRVKILTNSLAANDVPAVHAGYRRYRVGLLKAGVELYELMPLQNGYVLGSGRGFSGSSHSSLHAKTMIIDRSRMFIGSFNLDPRSIRLNTEMGILVESGRMAGDFMGWLEGNLSRISYRLELAEDNDTDNDQDGSGPHLRWIELKDGEEIVYDNEPGASLWRHLQVLFYSLLPIENQL